MSYGKVIGAALGTAITLSVIDKTVLSKIKKEKKKKPIDKIDDYLYDY